MINPTYDKQPLSPPDKTDRDNVNNLDLAWSRGLPQGAQETAPIVYKGIKCLAQLGASILAVDVTTKPP